MLGSERLLPPGIHFLMNNLVSLEFHIFMSLQQVFMKLRIVTKFSMINFSTGVVFFVYIKNHGKLLILHDIIKKPIE